MNASDQWKVEQMSWSRTRDRLDENDCAEWAHDPELLGGWFGQLLAGVVMGAGFGAAVIWWLS